MDDERGRFKLGLGLLEAIVTELEDPGVGEDHVLVASKKRDRN